MNEPQHLIGRQLGGYEVTDLIGQGGFAWVFKGRTAGGGDVALKVLKPRYSGDRQFESRFQNESELASRLRHPNIVTIHEVGHAQGLTFLAMEYYPESLASMLARTDPLPESLLVGMAIDICDALEFAHGEGVIHRDIKIDNIMFRTNGSAVLTDFGIAKAASGHGTRTGANMTIGTPHYVSPEQAQGRKLDGRSDIYALGVTLYRAATADLPFRSSDWFELARMHVEERPTSPRKLQPGISKRLERVIMKCLAKHPDDRYESAASLKEELRQLQDVQRRTSMFGTPPPATLAGQVPQRTMTPPVVWVVAALGIVLGIAAVVWFLGR